LTDMAKQQKKSVEELTTTIGNDNNLLKKVALQTSEDSKQLSVVKTKSEETTSELSKVTTLVSQLHTKLLAIATHLQAPVDSFHEKFPWKQIIQSVFTAVLVYFMKWF